MKQQLKELYQENKEVFNRIMLDIFVYGEAYWKETPEGRIEIPPADEIIQVLADPTRTISIVPVDYEMIKTFYKNA